MGAPGYFYLFANFYLHLYLHVFIILECFGRFWTLFNSENKKQNPHKRSVHAGFALVRPEGFEPPAFGIGIHCDIQLRHGRIFYAPRSAEQ